MTNLACSLTIKPQIQPAKFQTNDPSEFDIAHCPNDLAALIETATDDIF
jgi:hypothetical protein